MSADTTEKLKENIDELMAIIVDGSPGNMPLKQKARERLVEILRESKWIEKQVRGNGINPAKGWGYVFEDCIQECCMSIFEKCVDYNPGEKAQPMTYLTNILTYTILDFKKRIMNPGATEHYSNLANKVRGALASLKEEGHPQPTTEMVATYAGISMQQAEDALTIIRSGSGYDSFIMSPDTLKPGTYESPSARPVSIGYTPDIRDPAEITLEKMEREAVQDELKKIGGLEIKAFLLYYAYGEYENAECAHSYQKVSRYIGNISTKEAKKMIEGVKNQLMKNIVFRKLYGADDG